MATTGTHLTARRRGEQLEFADAETKTPFRIRPLTLLFVGAAVVLVAVGVVYFAMSHPKHGALCVALAIGALIGAWFSTGDARLKAD